MQYSIAQLKGSSSVLGICTSYPQNLRVWDMTKALTLYTFSCNDYVSINSPAVLLTRVAANLGKAIKLGEVCLVPTPDKELTCRREKWSLWLGFSTSTQAEYLTSFWMRSSSSQKPSSLPASSITSVPEWLHRTLASNSSRLMCVSLPHQRFSRHFSPSSRSILCFCLNGFRSWSQKL